MEQNLLNRYYNLYILTINLITYRHILMGRMMGFEPTRDGATIRCVNHFTTFAINGRGCRNRTHIDGFGDRCTTVVRSPYLILFYYTKFSKQLQVFNYLKKKIVYYYFLNQSLGSKVLQCVTPWSFVQSVFELALIFSISILSA